MQEILIEHRKILAMVHGVEQMLAHTHERSRTVRRQIETAKELEPPRLGDAMQLRGRRFRR